jgi:hypothetical protein
MFGDDEYSAEEKLNATRPLGSLPNNRFDRRPGGRLGFTTKLVKARPKITSKPKPKRKKSEQFEKAWKDAVEHPQPGGEMYKLQAARARIAKLEAELMAKESAEATAKWEAQMAKKDRDEAVARASEIDEAQQAYLDERRRRKPVPAVTMNTERKVTKEGGRRELGENPKHEGGVGEGDLREAEGAAALRGTKRGKRVHPPLSADERRERLLERAARTIRTRRRSGGYDEDED